MGKLFVVSSPSASGKTTIVDNISKTFDLCKLKTCTSRPVRESEKGDEYYFLNRPCFEHKIKENEFIEYSKVYENYYGVLREEFSKLKENNCIIILDVQGKEIIERELHIISIFIKPPDKNVVLDRLHTRNTDSDDVTNRIAEFDKELSEIDKYNYAIEYGDLKNMIDQMKSIIEQELIPA